MQLKHFGVPIDLVKGVHTHRCAMPAFLTALEMAFTAVHIAFRRVVSSPVPLAFLPSSSRNLVKVTTLVSNELRSDMAAVCRDKDLLADVKMKKISLL